MMRTRKTDTPIAIPLHPVIQRILESDFDLSKTISDQKMNVYIKVVAKMAGIDEKVTICEHRGGEVKAIFRHASSAFQGSAFFDLDGVRA